MCLVSSSAGLLHRSPVVAFHVSFPSQLLLVVHDNLEELKNPFLSLRMNPFSPKALMRTVAFAEVFLSNSKLYKIPSNLSICQNPLFSVPHPQRHYPCHHSALRVPVSCVHLLLGNRMGPASIVKRNSGSPLPPSYTAAPTSS